jgi:hypothetical protein
MLIPFIALIVVFAIIIFFVVKNSKEKDKGNTPA